MKYYEGVDYFLFFLDFPHMGVPGVIASNSDGTANIYINTLYQEEIRRRTIKHELRHLVKNHFYIDWMTIEEKEMAADDIDDPSCAFADDFSWVEYVEPEKTPDLFLHPVGVIPVFHSLDGLRNYIIFMKDQEKQKIMEGR